MVSCRTVLVHRIGSGYTDTHTHTHTYACMHTYVRTNIGTYIRTTYVHRHIHTYIHTHIHTYTHTYKHTYTHTYIHTHIHTYTHTYIHTYIGTYKCNAYTHRVLWNLSTEELTLARNHILLFLGWENIPSVIRRCVWALCLGTVFTVCEKGSEAVHKCCFSAIKINLATRISCFA